MKLKLCPFCGAAPLKNKNYVYCAFCHTTGPYSLPDFFEIITPEESWNTRATYWQKWPEEKPTLEQVYFCVDQHGNIDLMNYTHPIKIKSPRWESLHGNPTLELTHWMPLPDPPEDK